MGITPNSKVAKTEHTLLQELDREAVLLNLHNNQYYRLDETSLRMFNVMISSVNLESAREVLLAEFKVSADELWKDLVIFAEDLEKSGLVLVTNE